MKNAPFIGISGSIEHDESKQFIHRDYCTAILAAGGIPLLLSLDMDQEQLDTCLAHVDGVLLAGGTDVDPHLFGETPHPSLGEVDPRRDQFEMKLLASAKEYSLPVLGICRGMQVMNAAAGGTLYQDLQAQYALDHPGPAILHTQTALPKYPSHEVRIAPQSRLAELLPAHAFPVNSHHHQAIRTLAPDYVATAHAPDGVIEAMETPAHPFWIGVQWHPERMHRKDAIAQALFASFVQAAAHYAEGRSK